MFNPDTTLRLQIRQDVEKELRNNYSNGTYSETKKIVEILNFLYNYHYDKICDIIKGINTKEMVSFLLFEYELIENDDRIKSETGKDIVLFKETIHFLLDLIAEKKSQEVSNTIYFYENEFFNRLWIHAEKALVYSNASNLSHRVSNNGKVQLTILPQNSKYFIAQNLLDNFTDKFKKFKENKKNNIELRNRYLNGNDLQKELFTLLRDDTNIGFEREFGLSYLKFEYIILKMIILNCRMIDTPDKIPCISDFHIDDISEKLKISKTKIKKLLNGIMLSKNQYKIRKREIWDYVQQERSRKRPLIQINYNGKDWYLFSPKMLESRICNIGEDLILSPQNRLPQEWDTGEIKKNLNQCKTKITNWFEHKTIELLKMVNIFGFKTGNTIRVTANETICIDSKIGPPDFMGYSKSDNAIIIIECKLLDCVFEPKGIQGELSKFLEKNGNKKNYVEKFNEKINWICENKQKIQQAIEYQCFITIPNDCNIVNYCFVTYYPTTLRYFYEDIPSPTLFELVDLYKIQSKWPFEMGQKTLLP